MEEEAEATTAVVAGAAEEAGAARAGETFGYDVGNLNQNIK